MYSTMLKVALVTGAIGGFAAGKLDLDVKIRDAIRNQQKRLMVESARTWADEMESRRLLAIPKDTPVG